MDEILHQRRYLIPFRGSLLPQIFTDTLVIGGGVAGLRAAISASAHGEVIVLAKGDFKHTNTAWAQGGIAGVMDPASDSTQSHYQDTITAGAGLCDGPVSRLVVDRGPALIEELINWGMQLDRDAAGKLSLGLEGGHATSRIVHARGDATGAEVQRSLIAKVRAIHKQTGGLRVFENCFALDLLTPTTEVGAPVMGAITHHAKHGLQMIWAKATIIATGGAGVVYRETTNPPQATADGIAMAFRAGASVADMAFTQFHPTTLYLAGASRSLISEAVRGAGAHLLDARGQRFMLAEHPLAELAPRDVVSQAIVRTIARQAGEGVMLDCRHIAGFDTKFPSISATLGKFGLIASRDLIPVHPAMHYLVGGVRTDEQGRTDIPGLYAAGESACSGLHGANRLASNSLLEGLVLGKAAGEASAEMRTAARGAPAAIISDIRPSDRGELDIADVRSSLRSAMWKNAGIERTGAKLTGAIEMIDVWSRYTLDKIFDEPAGWETQNMLLAASLVAHSAQWRKESRGCHLRLDQPAPREEMRVHDLWRRQQHGPLPKPVLNGSTP
jgi:L-aspartate oxidase